MKKTVLTITAIAMLLIGGNAIATPVVDGTNSLGEWTSGLLLNAFDPDESIPDDYDFYRIALWLETAGGGAGNGLYVLVDLYGTPTLTSLDEIAPIDPAFYTIGFDLNFNGSFGDSIDRALDWRLVSGTPTITVYDGTGSPVAGSPDEASSSVVEFFVPSSMYTFGNFNMFAILDNGGGPADDRLPNEFYATNVPEPTSATLFGFGLFGLIGGAIRKRFKA